MRKQCCCLKSDFNPVREKRVVRKDFNASTAWKRDSRAGWSLVNMKAVALGRTLAWPGRRTHTHTHTHVNIHTRDKKHKLYYNKNSPVMWAGHRVCVKSTQSSPHPTLPKGAEPPWTPGLRVPERGSPQALPPAQRLLSSRQELFHRRKIWTKITPRASAPEWGWPHLISFKNTWVINRHTNSSRRAAQGAGRARGTCSTATAMSGRAQPVPAPRGATATSPWLCPAGQRLLEQGKGRGSEGCRAGRGCSRHRRGRAAVGASAHLPQVV